MKECAAGMRVMKRKLDIVSAKEAEQVAGDDWSWRFTCMLACPGEITYLSCYLR